MRLYRMFVAMSLGWLLYTIFIEVPAGAGEADIVQRAVDAIERVVAPDEFPGAYWEESLRATVRNITLEADQVSLDGTRIVWTVQGRCHSADLVSEVFGDALALDDC